MELRYTASISGWRMLVNHDDDDSIIKKKNAKKILKKLKT